MKDKLLLEDISLNELELNLSRNSLKLEVCDLFGSNFITISCKGIIVLNFETLSFNELEFLPIYVGKLEIVEVELFELSGYLKGDSSFRQGLIEHEATSVYLLMINGGEVDMSVIIKEYELIK